MKSVLFLGGRGGVPRTLRSSSPSSAMAGVAPHLLGRRRPGGSAVAFSTASAPATPLASSAVPSAPSEGEDLLRLTDTERVFRAKSNHSLAFSLAILHMCSLYQPFSRYGPQVNTDHLPTHHLLSHLLLLLLV